MSDGEASVTLTVASAERPSLLAVMRAFPIRTAVTRPVCVTVATPGALEDQVIARLASAWPDRSNTVAASWTVSSTRAVAAPGSTRTAATAAPDVVAAGGAAPRVVVNTTVAEASARSCRRVMSSALVIGSSPDVGSSRKKTCGSVISSTAMLARLRWPPLSAPTRTSA